jgi:hypothetical protein
MEVDPSNCHQHNALIWTSRYSHTRTINDMRYSGECVRQPYHHSTGLIRLNPGDVAKLLCLPHGIDLNSFGLNYLWQLRNAMYFSHRNSPRIGMELKSHARVQADEACIDPIKGHLWI